MESTTETPELAERLRFLEATLSREGAPVERIETHLSWLLLGGERVFKLKKPAVRAPFFDLTTVAARERHARAELQANSRLAPQVYLGVLALCRDARDGWSLHADMPPAGAGVVDWVVAMRRLPAERMLDRVIATGTLRPGDVDALVELLARFYRDASHPRVAAGDYLRRLRDDLAASRAVVTLPRFGLARAAALCDALDHALLTHADALAARAPRLVEAHGDLRPEHVCLTDPPAVIDALEFDGRLRQLDPFDELAFLSLECALAGDEAIGPRLMTRCGAALGDTPPTAVLPIYTARRALMRAQLSAAHLFDPRPRLPEKWLPQAQRYLERAARALTLL